MRWGFLMVACLAVQALAQSTRPATQPAAKIRPVTIEAAKQASLKRLESRSEYLAALTQRTRAENAITIAQEKKDRKAEAKAQAELDEASTAIATMKIEAVTTDPEFLDDKAEIDKQAAAGAAQRRVVTIEEQRRIDAVQSAAAPESTFTSRAQAGNGDMSPAELQINHMTAAQAKERCIARAKKIDAQIAAYASANSLSPEIVKAMYEARPCLKMPEAALPMIGHVEEVSQSEGMRILKFWQGAVTGPMIRGVFPYYTVTISNGVVSSINNPGHHVLPE